jgi:ATP-dependent helicase/nuclease subunit B
MILTKTKIEFVDIDHISYDKVNSSRLNELLIVVPTNRKIRYLKRDIISNSPEKTISQLNLDTLATLSVKLFDAARDFYAAFLSDAAAVVLLSQAFSAVNLEYFSNYKNEVPRGTLELLRNVISEYKQHGISPENLLNQSDSLSGSEKLKANDISRIYAEYQKNTKELNAFELGDIYNYIITLDDEQFLIAVQSVFPEVNTIIINGFDEFSQPEIDLIDKLANISDISLYLSFDYYRYNPEIFSHLEDCYKNILGKGFVEIEDRSTVQYDDFRKTLRENLFSMKSLTPRASNIKILKLSASNPVKEIEVIAKEIKHLTISGKVHADEICVAFNLISEHSNVIRDVFNSYGIPYNLTDRYNLSNSAPVIALINFLEVLENDFYYKNIFRALSGRWIEIPGVDLANLLTVSVNLKLVAGYKQWINSINSVLEQMSNEFDEDVKYLQRRQYEKAKTDIQNIDNLLKPFRKNHTPVSFKKNLLSLISEIKLSLKLVNDNPGLIEKNVKAVTTLIETIDELFSLIEEEYGESKNFFTPLFS